MRAFVVVVVALGGCVGDSSVGDGGTNDATTDSANGGEGEPCYGNGTCNAGLVCLSKLCVAPADAATDASTDAGLDADPCLTTRKMTDAQVVCGTNVCGPVGSAGCCVSNLNCAASPGACATDGGTGFFACTDNSGCTGTQRCCFSTPQTLTNTSSCPRTLDLAPTQLAKCMTNCGGPVVCTADGPPCGNGQTCQRAYVSGENFFELSICAP